MKRIPIEEPDYFIAYPGGIVECSKATKFMALDENTGQQREIELPNRITVTYKKQKKSLSGPMVKALHDAYEQDDIVREFVSRC